jgi:hypothetical protein
MRNYEEAPLSYIEQKGVISSDIWFDVLITFWNDDNDKIKEESFITQYPNYFDIEQTMEMNGLLDNLTSEYGEFDNLEITSVKQIS